MEKLNVAAVTIEACSFVWRKRARLSLLALPGVVVFSIAPFLGSLLTGGGLNPYSQNSNSLSISEVWISGNWALGLIYLGLWSAVLLPFIMFSIAWHREYLAPDEAGSLKAAYVWRSRQWKFFRIYFEWFVLILMVMPVILFSVTMLFPIFEEVLGLVSLSNGIVMGLFVHGLSWIICGWFYARIALAFPAIAVDRTATSQGAWHFSRGNGGRLFLILAVVTIPYWATLWLVALPVQELLTTLDYTLALMASLAIAVGSAVLEFIGIAIGVTALSIAYRKLTVSGMAIEPQPTVD